MEAEDTREEAPTLFERSPPTPPAAAAATCCALGRE